MKVLKKNVFIGSKVKCVKLDTNKKKSSNFSKVETNVIFIQTKDDTYVDLAELKRCHLPSSLARKFVQQYKLIPEKVGNMCVANIQPYYKNQALKENERIDICEISETTKTL